MLATTVEALFGAINIDAGVNDSEAAITAALERLELDKHPMFQVRIFRHPQVYS
jgi:dsRNA-specific ribonuclease